VLRPGAHELKLREVACVLDVRLGRVHHRLNCSSELAPRGRSPSRTNVPTICITIHSPFLSPDDQEVTTLPHPVSDLPTAKEVLRNG